MGTIFSKIIRGEQPADRVYEDERLVVIKDLHPQAPVHLLFIPKKEYATLQDVPQEELHIISEMVEVAQRLAIKFGVADNYRFLTNVGKSSGQTVFHLHFHLIGGRALGSMA